MPGMSSCHLLLAFSILFMVASVSANQTSISDVADSRTLSSPALHSATLLVVEPARDVSGNESCNARRAYGSTTATTSILDATVS